MSDICVSIVSHDQAQLTAQLLADLQNRCPGLEIIVTHNIPESAAGGDTPGRAAVRHLENSTPKGFGANHNEAFRHCRSRYFSVLNPDIRIHANPFPGLLRALEDPGVGLVAPRVFNPSGELEDSVRRFPTPTGLLAKALGLGDSRIEVPEQHSVSVDWVAGMFMLFRSEAFAEIGGFDERFFLYYEDVDICARLWKRGWKVTLQPEASVVHAAQRASHRHARYRRWHLASMARYFAKHLGRLPQVERRS